MAKGMSKLSRIIWRMFLGNLLLGAFCTIVLAPHGVYGATAVGGIAILCGWVCLFLGLYLDCTRR